MERINLIDMVNDKYAEFIANGVPARLAKMAVSAAAMSFVVEMGATREDAERFAKLLADWAAS